MCCPSPPPLPLTIINNEKLTAYMRSKINYLIKYHILLWWCIYAPSAREARVRSDGATLKNIYIYILQCPSNYNQ